MRSYISYIIDGIWEAKQCILLGMILWLLWNLILFSLKKRNGERLKKYGFKYLFCELLLVIYLCTILTITGIIRTDISTYVYSVPNMTSLLNIPFKGGIWEAKQCILSKSFRHLQEDSLKLMI